MQASCSSAQVLGLPIEDATELLRKGDVGFIRKAELPTDFPQALSRLGQLTLIHGAAPFYAGLLVGDSLPGNDLPGNDAANETASETKAGRMMEMLLFCAALEGPSLPARREAALKLIPMILEAEGGREAEDVLGFLESTKSAGDSDAHTAVRVACLYSLERYDEVAGLPSAGTTSASFTAAGSAAKKLAEWYRLISLFAAWRLSSGQNAEDVKREISAFLFSALSGEVRSWAYGKAFSTEGLLTAAESSALSSRLIQGNYLAILIGLRQALEDDRLVFFRYPALVPDLGRAYQYTPGMRDEGARLFKQWAALLETPAGRPPEVQACLDALDGETISSLKFSLHFYTGRIERANGKFDESSEYFRRAHAIAPDTMQSDACTWYMLMNAMSKSPSEAASLAVATMPRWNDVSYFADVLDRLSCYFTGRRQWDTLLEIFSHLENLESGVSLAQYAWILGRAVQEGYIKTDRSAESFFRTAFEKGKDSFYYRAMAASALGEAFSIQDKTEPPQPSAAVRKKLEEMSEADFILGFFEYGAASFALPYIRERELSTSPQELSLEELRMIADALAASGLWKESLDLVSRYTSWKDYGLSYPDLTLFYPQPFRELIEKYAGEAELGPEILYGLIRTESYFVSGIVSSAGAVGLTQLMPPTAEEMAVRIARLGGPDYRGALLNLKDPEINVHIGSYYLRYLIDQMGSPMLALLAYNGGMGRVRRWLAADRQKGALPLDLFLETIEITETREYGRRVLAAAAVYGYLYYGMSMEEVAEDIW